MPGLRTIYESNIRDMVTDTLPRHLQAEPVEVDSEASSLNRHFSGDHHSATSFRPRRDAAKPRRKPALLPSSISTLDLTFAANAAAAVLTGIVSSRASLNFLAVYARVSSSVIALMPRGRMSDVLKHGHGHAHRKATTLASFVRTSPRPGRLMICRLYTVKIMHGQCRRWRQGGGLCWRNLAVRHSGAFPALPNHDRSQSSGTPAENTSEVTSKTDCRSMSNMQLGG